MSWQGYVDNQLVGTQKVTRGAILGLQGGVWAISPGYNLSPAEQTAVLNTFKDPATAQANGIRLNEQKFLTLQASNEHFYGKKGANGCVIVKTGQAVLIGEYEAPIQPGEATTVVQGLADYLISVGY